MRYGRGLQSPSKTLNGGGTVSCERVNTPSCSLVSSGQSESPGIRGTDTQHTAKKMKRWFGKPLEKMIAPLSVSARGRPGQQRAETHIPPQCLSEHFHGSQRTLPAHICTCSAQRGIKGINSNWTCHGGKAELRRHARMHAHKWKAKRLAKKGKFQIKLRLGEMYAQRQTI